MKNKNKNITTKFRKSKSGGKSGVVSALDYTRLLSSVQYVKKKYQIQWNAATHHDLAPIELLLGLGEPLLQTLQFCSSVGLGTLGSLVYIIYFGIVVF